MSKIKTIRKEGGSKVISITNVFPVDWQVVTIAKIKQSNNAIIVTFERIK